MIRFAILGSGSKGNSIYFNVDGYNFLVDAGFSKKELDKRLANFGRSLDDIQAVFITHDHGDHRATWLKDGNPLLDWNHRADVGAPLPWFIRRFPLQHDATSWGYMIRDNEGNKVAVIGDTGCVPEAALPYMFDCKAILIECNYDVDLLVTGPYSTEQQERIASDYGHLQNEDAAAVVECVAWGGLQYVGALHLSERNNRPAYVRQALEHALLVNGSPWYCEVEVSQQKVPSKMVVLM